MSTKIEDGGPALNTDREIWRERSGDFYADSIHVTASGSIGIDCGGMVYTLPVREWHRLAALSALPHAGVSEEMVEAALNVKPFDDGDENIQYILLRGLSAIGFTLPSHATWDVMRSALEAALSSEAVPVAAKYPLATFGHPDVLPLGLYRIHWKSGGSSLAAIGMMRNGDRWIAPTNWTAPGMNPTCEWSWGDMERAETSPVPADAGQPGIKALEWEDREERDEDGGTDVVGSYANALLDRSYFTSWDARHEAPWALYFTLRVVGRYETEKAAKAAAQADYEARIRSALIPTTSPAKGGAEVIARCGCEHPSLIHQFGKGYHCQRCGLPPRMNLNITKEWFEQKAALEGDLEIGAGSSALRTSAPVGQQAKEGE